MISSLKANTLDNEKQTQPYTIDNTGDSVLLHQVRQHGQPGGDACGELCADERHGADAEALQDEGAVGDRECSGRRCDCIYSYGFSKRIGGKLRGASL